jgi:hypothetical protein
MLTAISRYLHLFIVLAVAGKRQRLYVLACSWAIR